MEEGLITFENEKDSLKESLNSLKEKSRIVDSKEGTVIKYNHSSMVNQKNSINNKQFDEIYALKKELEIAYKINEQLEVEKKRLMIEIIDLKHKLEDSIINKIRLINKERVAAFETEKMMLQMKKDERDCVNLQQKCSKLENKYEELNKRYQALKDSKLGKVTIQYWKAKNRIKGGR